MAEMFILWLPPGMDGWLVILVRIKMLVFGWTIPLIHIYIFNTYHFVVSLVKWWTCVVIASWVKEENSHKIRISASLLLHCPKMLFYYSGWCQHKQLILFFITDTCLLLPLVVIVFWKDFAVVMKQKRRGCIHVPKLICEWIPMCLLVTSVWDCLQGGKIVCSDRNLG